MSDPFVYRGNLGLPMNAAVRAIAGDLGESCTKPKQRIMANYEMSFYWKRINSFIDFKT